MAQPERMCVGCRRRRPQAELVRCVLVDGDVVPATTGSMGRGAYVCPSVECLGVAERRRAFARAFRAPAALNAEVRCAVERRAMTHCNDAAPLEAGFVATPEERR